jgi:hypothetical protein
MSQITRNNVKCEGNCTQPVNITWHVDPQGANDFWSCDTCGAVQINLLPPAGAPISLDPFITITDQDIDDLIDAIIPVDEEAVKLDCFCFSAPHPDCPIHGAK